MRHLFFVNALFLAALVSCSDEPSSGSVPDAGSQPSVDAGADALESDGPKSDALESDTFKNDEAACAAYAKIRCEVGYRCTPTGTSMLFEDMDTCVHQLALDCEIELSLPAVSYSGADLVACAQAMSAATCEDFLMTRYYGTPGFPACDLPAGTSEDGVACSRDAECSSGNCFTDQTWPCGTCQPPVVYGPNCLGVECGENEICWKEPGSSEELQCTPAVGIGESCGPEPCLDGAPCTNGVCPVPAFGKEGAPCEPQPLYTYFWNSACYLFEYQCDAETNSCVPIPTPPQIGESCSNWPCAAGGVCEQGVCVPPLSVGSACGDGSCVFPSVCHEGICKLPSADMCE